MARGTLGGGGRCGTGWLGHGIVALLLASALLACQDLPFADSGLKRIREVSAGEGLRLLADPETVVVQVLDPARHAGRVAGTEPVSARDPIPDHIADTSATVVILAEDAAEGLRVAARLSRIGIPDVVVVRGGVSAWKEARDEPKKTIGHPRPG